MSGLLHSLAERAAGVAPRVRSTAALPYAAEALDWTGDADRSPVGVPRPDRENAAAPPLPEDARPMPLAVAPASPRAPAARRAEDAGAGGRAPPVAIEPPALDAAAGAGAARQDEPPEPRWSPSPVRPARRPSPPAESGSPTSAEARPAAAAIAPPPMPGDPVPAPMGTEPAPAAGLAAPQRLMPAEPVKAAVAAMGRAVVGGPPPASAGEARGDTANEVHIHIGRVEVTAVREPPARRPKPPAAPPLQTLDAYLAARRRT